MSNLYITKACTINAQFCFILDVRVFNSQEFQTLALFSTCCEFVWCFMSILCFKRLCLTKTWNCMQISVHLWATGKGTLSACSLLIIKDVAVVFNSNCFETCMIKAYKAFIDHCKFVDPVLFKHQQFLKSSFIELCSQDLQKVYSKAVISIQQLAKILQLGLRTKKVFTQKAIPVPCFV